MELLDYIRMTCRVSSNDTDAELQMLIDAAKADMVRVGIDEDYVDAEDALVVTAIGCYCKSRYGFDNADSAKFFTSYQQMVKDMMNGPQNVCCIEQREAREQDA